MTSVRVVVFVLLAAFVAAGGTLAQEKDRDQERKELREKILKKVDERLKRETERIKAEIEQILAEELGAAKGGDKRGEKKPAKSEHPEGDEHPAAKAPATFQNPGWLGTWVEGLSAELAEDLGVTAEDGAVLADIVAGGPAEKAGLAKNDLVLSFNGKKIGNPEEMLAEVKKAKAGEQVKVVVQRKDGKKTLTVTMGERPTSPAVAKAERKPEAKTQPKTAPRDGEGSAKLRERIKGFLDKMMVEEEGDEDDDQGDAKPTPKNEAKNDGAKNRPAERLQERIREFMDRMNPGREKEEGDEEGEDEESDDEMLDDRGQGLQQLGEIAQRFFQEILKDKGGKDEEGGEDDEMGEGDMPDFNRLLEGAKKFMEENGGELEKRFRDLQEGIEKRGGEAQEEGRDRMGKMRNQIERLLEDMGGENGEGLKGLLEKLDLDKIQKQIREMMQGQDWEEALDNDLEDEGPAPKVEKKHTPKNVPAERETSAAGGGYLGVKLDDVSEELRAHHDLGDHGAIVTSVVDGSPAAQAGLKQWDIVVRLDGKEVASADGLIEAVQNRKPGDTLKISVLRRGKEKTLEVTLGKRPSVVTPKWVNPFHFISFDPFQGAGWMAPRDGEDAKKKDRSNKEEARRAPGRQSPDQMRQQMMQGLKMLQSFFKDRELYWQLTTKDGQVIYKQRIEPEQLAEMARSEGQGFLRGLLNRRGSRGEAGTPARPSFPGFPAVPGTPLTGSRKGDVRVYEAPGIRIEIRDDQLKEGRRSSSRRDGVVGELLDAGKEMLRVEKHEVVPGDKVVLFDKVIHADKVVPADKVIRIEKHTLAPKTLEHAIVLGPDGQECPAGECPAIGSEGATVVIERAPHAEVKVLRKVEAAPKAEKKTDKKTKKSRKHDRNEVI